MRNHLGTQALAAALFLAVATVGTSQEKPAGGPSEGIKVHGHWTIEVREPDGTLVSRTEFENALAPDMGQGSGAQFLTRLLSRDAAVGKWNVTVHTDRQCTGIGPCYLDESSPLEPGAGRLTVSAPTSGEDAGKFVLTGTLGPVGNLMVLAVETKAGTCAPTVAPAACGQSALSAGRSFTFHSPPGDGILATTTAGQTITVKVVISFS